MALSLVSMQTMQRIGCSKKVAEQDLYHVQAVSLLSVEQMNNGMLYAVWAIPTALVFLGIGAVISRRVFAKHQVS